MVTSSTRESWLPSDLEAELYNQIQYCNLPLPDTEYRFYPKRRWRADFAWVDQKLIVEVEGGTYMRGRHTRGAGFEKDCEKYNRAALEGWRVLRFTSKQIKSGEAISMIEEALSGHRI